MMKVGNLAASFQGFNVPQVSARGSESLRRAKSIARSPLDGRKDGGKRSDGEVRCSEVRGYRLLGTVPC